MEGDKFYGAKATINVWKPQIQEPNEFSLSQIWILGGSFGEDLNSIEAGWQVNIYYFHHYFLCSMQNVCGEFRRRKDRTAAKILV